MTLRTSVCSALLLGLLAVSISAESAETNWKRGRVYYRMVCTDCHALKTGGPIAPSAWTMAEWKAYIQADRHNKGKDSPKYYVSKQYRDRVKAINKAAAKFDNVPEADLLNDIKAFVNHGAKDGDSPASCS